MSAEQYTKEVQFDYDREKDVKAFDDTKAGVRGLVDAGVQSIPKFFIRPPNELAQELNVCHVNLEVPVIDLAGIEMSDRRDEIVREIFHASQKWGFFQVVNHSIPLEVLDKMLQGIRMFHEQDVDVKKEFYTRERKRNILYNSNYDLFKMQAANWRLGSTETSKICCFPYPERFGNTETRKRVGKFSPT